MTRKCTYDPESKRCAHNRGGGTDMKMKDTYEIYIFLVICIEMYMVYPLGGMCCRLQRRQKIKCIVHKGIVEFIWIKIITHVQA